MYYQTEIGTDIERAAALLGAGELVAIPTETVYGLAGNALNSKSVAAIFEVKNRPHFDPLILHVASAAMLAAWAAEVPPLLQRLADVFMPGPLTLLLPKQDIIPELVTSGLPRVALRVPAHPLTRALLEKIAFPLAAPSANPFGYISPTTALHVFQQLQGKIPYILDGGSCSVGLESTIVGMEEGEVVVYRKGGLAVEQIEALLGKVRVNVHSSSNPMAPGMLKSHYAPRVPLVLGHPEDYRQQCPAERMGVISFRHKVAGIPDDHQCVLSPEGHLAEAAQQLFAVMRYLDGKDLDLIVAELVPEQQLGRAINDRLRRAAATEAE
jgi:L-threonylcarbamoyladenylate synthase